MTYKKHTLIYPTYSIFPVKNYLFSKIFIIIVNSIDRQSVQVTNLGCKCEGWLDAIKTV